MNNTDYLRSRIYNNIFLYKTFNTSRALAVENKFFGTNGILSTIVKYARLRKLMGAFRYTQKHGDGLSHDEKAKLGKATSFLTRLEDKIYLYKTTGNKENLVDAFNYILLEWDDPSIPNTYFKSTERKEV